MSEGAVAEFTTITGSDAETAKKFLGQANGSIEMAVTNFFNQTGEDVNDEFVVISSSPKGNGPPPPVPKRNHQPAAVEKTVVVEEEEKSKEKERDLAKLLAKYRTQVDQLREATKDVANEEGVHDDIYFLRYVLSFDHATAVDNIRFAVAWKKEPVHAYWIDRAVQKEQKHFDESQKPHEERERSEEEKLAQGLSIR